MGVSLSIQELPYLTIGLRDEEMALGAKKIFFIPFLDAKKVDFTLFYGAN